MVILLVLIFVLDADITTRYYERFGVQLDNYYREKVIWITGASTGIGAALALKAAKSGAMIVISARNENLLREVRDKCVANGADKDNILVLPLDMCAFDQHEVAFKTVLNKFGKLDVLVHNAGRSQRARWEHTDMEVDRNIFELNVFSVVNLTRQG